MAHLLAYLVGLPHHGSPLVFPTCPQLLCPPKIHGHRRRMAYIPHWRGEGQVAASLGVEGPKKDEISMTQGL